MSNPKPQFPPIEDALLAALAHSFPSISIDPKSPVNDIMFSAGQQNVIQFLQRIAKQQREGKPQRP